MAVQLTATDQYLLRSDAYLDTTNAFTIAMWFRQGFNDALRIGVPHRLQLRRSERRQPVLYLRLRYRHRRPCHLRIGRDRPTSRAPCISRPISCTRLSRWSTTGDRLQVLRGRGVDRHADHRHLGDLVRGGARRHQRIMERLRLRVCRGLAGGALVRATERPGSERDAAHDRALLHAALVSLGSDGQYPGMATIGP